MGPEENDKILERKKKYPFPSAPRQAPMPVAAPLKEFRSCSCGEQDQTRPVIVEGGKARPSRRTHESSPHAPRKFTGGGNPHGCESDKQMAGVWSIRETGKLNGEK